MEWIILAISAISAIYILYHAYIGVVGNLKELEPIPYAAPGKRLALVIPARNEARVVGLLIDSLNKQRYPRELFDIYVIPNNCIDDTEQEARRAGAHILHCPEETHSKGEVLHHTFAQLLESERAYDGFVIFDADNIADSGFLQVVNNAMAAGYQVGQAYRDSKNPDDSWIAGCTSMFFWFMNRFFNHPRAALGLSASLNGTGVMVGADFLRRHGYNTTTLTEDLEFSAQCALAGEKIAWMEEAIFYDEQPLKLKDSFIQRRRWAAGSRQCAQKYLWSLFACAPKSKLCLDVAMHFLSVYTVILGLVPVVLTIATLVRRMATNFGQGIEEALYLIAVLFASSFFSGALITLIVCSLETKLRKQRMTEVMTLGWFMMTWLPINLIGFLWRPPTWTAIPHTNDIGIEDCERQNVPIRPLAKKETSL
ncbi:MAG: glycosyltransferase family 2 protein [Eubacteriales bacterium]|nr:glycosyltransferase family 2 protein [Christensenellaceae bacterium]MEA5066029.1 glycosyltransferase family 2 protein [Eubacteriales bacterium]